MVRSPRMMRAMVLAMAIGLAVAPAAAALRGRGLPAGENARQHGGFVWDIAISGTILGVSLRF